MVELVRAGSFSVGGSGLSAEAPLSFESTPRIARVGSGSHWRTAVLTEPGTWSWKLTVPSGGSLHLGVEVFGPDGATPPTMEAVVAVVSPERRKVVRVVSPQELDSPGWLDLILDLARWSGDEVICEVSTRVLDVEARPMPGVELAWSPTRVVSSDARRAGKAPNIVLVVIDTLRYDFLSAYGAGRWASPRMASTLERRGAVFEQAYAQAPWTLPSMISLMTGTHPAEILGRDPAAYAVPTDLVTLPERLQHAGYETAAFIGNPTLHHGNGFARGLEELYISPAENAFVSSIEDEIITVKASSWLGSRGSAPFFLYVHYLAPHDPYSNSVQFLGRSLRRPFYFGRITGLDVHDLFLGTKTLDDPSADLRHLRALYATEVRYVDRWLGRLFAAVPERLLEDTLFVVTADHGEELLDHGGWKHGRTLYEEQLRVPLLVRWDGKVEPGKRISSPARLMDIAPTLLQAAGLEADSGSGRSLLPLLVGSSGLDEVDLYAEQLNFGPRKVSVTSGGEKLVLFDVNERTKVESKLQQRLLESESKRIPRAAVYDLRSDPGEQTNLIEQAPTTVRRLLPVLHRRMGRTTAGLRVVASAVPSGGTLEVRLRFDVEPDALSSYFLAADDRVALEGRDLQLELGSDVIDKGVLVKGAFQSVELVEVLLDGRPLPEGSFVTLAGPSSPAEALSLDLLRGPAPPSLESSGGEPRLWLWLPEATPPTPPGAIDPETLRRLRALGYV